jgi:hypothetical protein
MKILSRSLQLKQDQIAYGDSLALKSLQGTLLTWFDEQLTEGTSVKVITVSCTLILHHTNPEVLAKT